MDRMQLALNEYSRVIQCSQKEAREDMESDVSHYMAEGMSKDQAMEQWIGENLDLSIVEQMSEKAKANGTEKVVAKSVDAYGKKRTRTKKVNNEKVEVMETLLSALVGLVDSAVMVNNERTISFEWKGSNYSVNLTCHRKPKGEK